jgi:hypothetical protein
MKGFAYRMHVISYILAGREQSRQSAASRSQKEASFPVCCPMLLAWSPLFAKYAPSIGEIPSSPYFPLTSLMIG